MDPTILDQLGVSCEETPQAVVEAAAKAERDRAAAEQAAKSAAKGAKGKSNDKSAVIHRQVATRLEASDTRILRWQFEQILGYRTFR